MKTPVHHRVEIPPGHDIDDLRAWCQENLIGRVRLKHPRRWDPRRKKWVKDHSARPTFKFTEDIDAVAFKLRWLEPK